MASENGWEPARVGPDALEWVTVPGTDVTLQLMKGWPLAIMRAYAADYNAFVEPLRDPDSAAWTPTNSVATSNHLNGTAMDLNWNSHPFRVSFAGYDQRMIDTMREILDFYEDTMFWAQDWDSPKDCMHHQMGYGSWNNPRTGDFIRRKIRADGYSMFRRGNTPPPPPPLSRADRYALLIIAEGRRRGITPRGIQIALATGLVESNLTIYANAKVPASMNIPHDAVGFDGYSVGIFQQQVRDTGNGWWWGDAATCMDPTSSAGLFYDRLARLDYNGRNSPGSYAQAVQQSAFPDRYDQRFDEAVDLYNRLAGTQPPPPQPGDDMALVPQEQWDALFHAVMNQRRSRSPLRELDEGDVGDAPDQIWDIDASIHILVVYLMAMLGNPGQLALLNRVASADPVRYPDRQADRQVAQAILADVAANDELKQGILAALGRVTAARPAQLAPLPDVPPPPPRTVYLPAPVEPAQTNGAKVDEGPKSTGETIGELYSALEALRLADALPIESRAPLAALISVLQTKNGSQI